MNDSGERCQCILDNALLPLVHQAGIPGRPFKSRKVSPIFIRARYICRARCGSRLPITQSGSPKPFCQSRSCLCTLSSCTILQNGSLFCRAGRLTSRIITAISLKRSERAVWIVSPTSLTLVAVIPLSKNLLYESTQMDKLLRKQPFRLAVANQLLSVLRLLLIHMFHLMSGFQLFGLRLANTRQGWRFQVALGHDRGQVLGDPGLLGDVLHQPPPCVRRIRPADIPGGRWVRLRVPGDIAIWIDADVGV